MTDLKMANHEDLNLILEEIRDLEDVILLHKELIEKYPTNNIALRISLEQAELRKNDLVAELRSTSCGDEPESDEEMIAND
ncbi:MAG: hypothetical protein DDT19_00891 [Syntrophomonadaceae bacterium]|nr:hypothetical protein [Bacillota bacterium]